MEKYMTTIDRLPLPSGSYPVFYSGYKVGMATVEGEKVVMTIDLEDTKDDDRNVTLKKLSDKLKDSVISMSTVGNVDFSVLRGYHFDVISDPQQLVINDLPEYVASEQSIPPPAE